MYEVFLYHLKKKVNMKGIRYVKVRVSSCEKCPHFFKEGYLFEGQRYCTRGSFNIEHDIDLELEISENCPLPE